jgi:uncharacterized protein (DUF1697 family)
VATKKKKKKTTTTKKKKKAPTKTQKAAAKKASSSSSSSASASASSGAVRGVALLRGINVGGNNKLPMEQLRAMFEDAGCDDVVSYIASGNVVFTTTSKTYATLHTVIEAKIKQALGLTVPLVLRTKEQLQAALKNPFLDERPPPERKHLFVMFLSTTPTAAQASSLDPNRSPGDRFVVKGSEIFLCLQAAADTRITNAWIDKQLATTSTSRNLNTVDKLIALCG